MLYYMYIHTVMFNMYCNWTTFMVVKGDDGRLFHFIKHNIFHIPTCILKIKAEEIFTNISEVFN